MCKLSIVLSSEAEEKEWLVLRNVVQLSASILQAIIRLGQLVK